jgi:adenosylcobinamide-GDP ribazoletransferase
MDIVRMNGATTISHIKDWLDDLRVAVALLTRIPMPHPDGALPPNIARCERLFPLVGAAVGAVVGLVDLALLAAGLPALAAAALALGASALLTGALHEDGLADLADGFGGGRDRAAKLEIMRDSRLGTYGALILLVAFVARMSALAVLSPAAIVPSLIATHALARGPLPLMARTMPFARPDGLGQSAGRPEPMTVAIAVAIALAIALLCLPAGTALMAATVTALTASTVTVLAWRQIGGVSGDVLGAAEQVAETAVLLLLAARPT